MLAPSLATWKDAVAFDAAFDMVGDVIAVFACGDYGVFHAWFIKCPDKL
jgi:hypothetical protein